MVYSETVPDASVILALRLLVLDLVEFCPPLRVRVLLWVSGGRGWRHTRRRYFEGCGPPLCDVSHNDFRVVILEYPQQAGQVVVAARLAG